MYVIKDTNFVILLIKLLQLLENFMKLTPTGKQKAIKFDYRLKLHEICLSIQLFDYYSNFVNTIFENIDVNLCVKLIKIIFSLQQN